jgi:hypothetical protein
MNGSKALHRRLGRRERDLHAGLVFPPPIELVQDLAALGLRRVLEESDHIECANEDSFLVLPVRVPTPPGFRVLICDSA